MIKVTTRMNINFPDFGDAQRELEKIASKIIVPDIQSRMKSGINISGSMHPPNAPATRVNKALRGLRTAVPLIASGQLLSSFRVTLLGDKAVQIMPRGTRQPYPRIKSKYRLRKTKPSISVTPTNYELADILQNKRGYEFFGISDTAEGKAMKHMFDYIKKVIKSGGRKPI